MNYLNSKKKQLKLLFDGLPRSSFLTPKLALLKNILKNVSAEQREIHKKYLLRFSEKTMIVTVITKPSDSIKKKQR